MKAIVQDRYGLADVLALREIGKPTPGHGEVLIKVRGSSVNYGDHVMMTGQPYASRLVLGFQRPKHAVLGMDVAGIVEAVGAGATRFKVGDAVYGEANRTYAEYVCVSERRLAYKPANMSFEMSAAFPVAAITALQGLRDKAGVKPGDKVLINGASGGVGTFAVQIARAFGAEVTAVCSTRNVDMVRALGAAHVVDYTQEDFSQTSARYDAIFDLVGTASIGACRRILAPGGVYVSSVGRMGWSLKSLLASFIPGPGKVVLFAAKPTAADLDVLRHMAEAGQIEPVIDRRYTLSEVPSAMRAQGQGHARGKSIIVL